MLALCITVKNEEALLADNLRYHRAAGVDAFYIFDDGCTDATLATLREIPGVHIAPSVDPAAFLDHPHLGWIAARAFTLITGRQTLNAHVAFQQALLAGHQWMISLDADELLFIDTPQGLENSLRRFFTALPPDIEAVVFKPAELIPTRLDASHPLRENGYFRTRCRKNSRRVQDPYTGQSVTIHDFIGHTTGKSAARIRPDIIHQSVHQFTSFDHGPLRRKKAYWLLHYNISSFPNFIAKFRRFHDHPDTYLNGAPIEAPRSLWMKMCNDPHLSEADLLRYYQENLLEDVTKLEHQPGVRRFQKVAAFFAV